MLKDITLGQFYPADSVLHRLDPRVKLVGTIAYIVSLFLINGVFGWVVAIGFLAVMIGLSGVPVKMMLKGIRGIWVLILITAVCNFFFTRTGAVILQKGVISITATGIHNCVYYSLRLIFLVVGASVMTLTTSPDQLTDGLETGLRCLKKIGLPISELAMMMSIALRFIPILGDEAEKVKKAQMARGASFDEGGLLMKVKSLVPILVPLFVSAFRRANDLSLAMEARCYNGGEGRTRMKPLRYAGRDAAGYLIMLVYFAAMIAVHAAIAVIL
ncbi:MAG: energy-coupling factor transporter transmembrane protein EcfT [Clostridiales bacterium]|nr:energy-coupling factor transporter transmembrane protein EcfT [Clostridiales bacterium]